MYKELENRVVIITGAGRGIGRGIALRFAENKSKITVVDLYLERADAVAKEIIDLGSAALSVRADVSRSDDWDEIVKATLEAFGKIHVLVNNAGTSPIPEMVINTSEEDFDRVMAINMRSVFLGCRKVARQMIDQGEGGRIINIASQAGKTGFPRLAPYCASKGAILAFTRAIALELIKYNILINSICPGTVDTPLIRENTMKMAEQSGIAFEKLWDSFLKKVPIGRFETPDDVAKMVTFLASEGGDYMTGQAINVTGGMEMH